MRQLILTVILILGSFVFIFSDEEIIIGREEGDGMLIYPRQIEEGPDGNIFISGLWDDAAQKRNYWLLDENGNALAKIGAEFSYLIISKHFIFYRTTDEEDNILINCLKRTGTEKEDLLRLEKK